MQLSFRSLVPSSFACAFVLAGCPGNNGDEGASTSEHGAEHGAEHSHEHGTSEHATGHGTTEHGADDHDHSIDTSADDPTVAYCSCVLANCHEPYHMKWGEDEMMAEQACLLEADMLPMNGSDIEMGNFIECRMHFCEMAAADPAVACPNALGDAVCV